MCFNDKPPLEVPLRSVKAIVLISQSRTALTTTKNNRLTPTSTREWLVSGFDFQAPAIVSLHQPASHLASLYKDQDAREQVVVENQCAEQHLQWPYGQLKTAALCVSGFLSSQIKQKHISGNGQTVIVTFAWNSVEWCVVFFAAIALGMPLSPLDPSYLDQPDECR